MLRCCSGPDGPQYDCGTGFSRSAGTGLFPLPRPLRPVSRMVSGLLNVSQQAVQAWEAGRRRIQISILPAVARLLAVSLEDLLGEEPEKIARKRGPAPKWQQLIEEIDSLPKAKQKMISEMLSALIVQARN